MTKIVEEGVEEKAVFSKLYSGNGDMNGNKNAVSSSSQSTPLFLNYFFFN